MVIQSHDPPKYRMGTPWPHQKQSNCGVLKENLWEYGGRNEARFPTLHSREAAGLSPQSHRIKGTQSEREVDGMNVISGSVAN